MPDRKRTRKESERYRHLRRQLLREMQPEQRYCGCGVKMWSKAWKKSWKSGSKYAEATIDHKVPRALGGTDDIHNMRVICRACNELKGADLEQIAVCTFEDGGGSGGSCAGGTEIPARGREFSFLRTS